VFVRKACVGVLGLLLTQGTAFARDTRPAKSPSTSQDRAGLDTDRACSVVKQVYGRVKGVKEGKNADYIPALAKEDPSQFGIFLVTADGRTCEAGDTKDAFSIQSISKAFTAAAAMQARGPDAIEEKIGVNATGMPFNSILAVELNEKRRAGNPLVNPGAIATVSLVPGSNATERWNTILGTMSRAAGRRLTVDEVVYKSESDTNTRNGAIANLLKAYEVLEGDPEEVLDLYTRQCSVSVTARDLAMMGATLASGGVQPMTGERIFDPAVAAKTLAVMGTNGLYETSGVWAFEVGVPAKSGVGGGIVAVVPGRYAIGTFAPPLDEAGNSVRGQRAIEAIVKELGGNVFDSGPRAGTREARRPETGTR
jgi:glutaminase